MSIPNLILFLYLSILHTYFYILYVFSLFFCVALPFYCLFNVTLLHFAKY
ncbi:hypothetical protein HMPREF2738_03364 [Clostridiales bacterium KLE1615]|nr:hypothetical protein HMPREF2738_03364 [Clostridiales bacterium KLE1615]